MFGTVSGPKLKLYSPSRTRCTTAASKNAMRSEAAQKNTIGVREPARSCQKDGTTSVTVFSLVSVRCDTPCGPRTVTTVDFVVVVVVGKLGNLAVKIRISAPIKAATKTTPAIRSAVFRSNCAIAFPSLRCSQSDLMCKILA